MRPASRHRVWYQHVFIATALNLLQISLGSTVNFYNPSIANCKYNILIFDSLVIVTDYLH